MEWRKYYMDLMLVPLGLVIILAYHVWLWHKSRTQPFTTIFGIDADGQHLWIPAMMKDIEKTNILAVQSLRNLIMGSTLMATKFILICAGLGAVISPTYSVKEPINNSVFWSTRGICGGIEICHIACHILILISMSHSIYQVSQSSEYPHLHSTRSQVHGDPRIFNRAFGKATILSFWIESSTLLLPFPATKTRLYSISTIAIEPKKVSTGPKIQSRSESAE